MQRKAMLRHATRWLYMSPLNTIFVAGEVEVWIDDLGGWEAINHWNK